MPVDVALANRAWEALMTAHTTLLRQFAAEEIWRENGLTMREYDVLYTLAKLAAREGDHPRGARIGELQHGVLLSQPALSRMVDRLAERGLVERVEDRDDRRAVRVRLSPAGRELQQTVGRAHARSVALAVSATLNESDQRELSRIASGLASPQRTTPIESQ